MSVKIEPIAPGVVTNAPEETPPVVDEPGFWTQLIGGIVMMVITIVAGYFIFWAVTP
jgi:hypothetical protein